jgi:Na+-driven multidrug efflux pump
VAELQAWSALAATGAGGLAVSTLPDVITLVFVGRLGVTPLASVSLAALYAWGVAEVVSVGLSLGHGALAAQATGARQYVAVFGWTALLLLSSLAAAAALLAPVFATGGQLIAACNFAGIDGALASEFLLWSMPALAILPLLQTADAHLTAIQRLPPVLASDVTYCAVDVLASWLLILGADAGAGVRVGGLGVRGAALANVISAAASTAVAAVAIAWFAMPPPPGAGDEEGEEEVRDDGEEAAGVGDAAAAAVVEIKPSLAEPLLGGGAGAAPRQSTVGSDAAAALAAHERAVAHVTVPAVLRFLTDAKNLRVFAIQSGSAVASMALEIASDTVISFIAASQGGTAAAVSNSLGEVNSLASAAIFGAFQATSVRVGHALGGRRPAAARRVGVVAGAAVAAWVALFSAALLASRRVLGYAFSGDADVVAGVDDLVPWFCAHYAAFSAYVHTASILDGQGRAHLYPLVSVLVVAVQLPLAFASAHYTSWGLRGLWSASAVGFAAGFVASAALVARSDWRALVDLAVSRSRAEDGEAAAGARGGSSSSVAGEGGGAAVERRT